MEDRKPQVWYGPMPESNGKQNFTAILHSGKITEGFFLARSEYPDRVRYDADMVRYHIGDLEERPSLRNYDFNLHSGWKSPLT